MSKRIEVIEDTVGTGGAARTVYAAYDHKYYGCMAQGDTEQEARVELNKARKDYLATLGQLGRKKP
jgi:predicted RNase H-like HicB family nuclease